MILCRYSFVGREEVCASSCETKVDVIGLRLSILQTRVSRWCKLLSGTGGRGDLRSVICAGSGDHSHK